MNPVKSLAKSLENAVNFINAHLFRILPFSLLFFSAILTYSIIWYALDVFGNIACINGNYMIELLFCNIYLGVLGKHIIAVTISSLSIIPFAGLVYLLNKIVEGDGRGIVESIKESIPGIIKIIIFRAGLTIAIFSPFIIFMVFGGGIIADNITSTGRLTIQKLLMINLLPIPMSLIFGFVLGAVLEPVFQYVEYEVLILGSRVRDAVKNSFKLAMQYKAETFISGISFVIIWDTLIFMKYLYLVNTLLVISLLAAIFLESFLVFPVRAVYLYFLWKRLKGSYINAGRKSEKEELKTYTNKMLLG